MERQSNIKPRQEDIERRIEAFRNDSIILYYKEIIYRVELFHQPTWLIKNGNAEPIKHPDVRRLEAELNDYINNRYADIIIANPGQSPTPTRSEPKL